MKKIIKQEGQPLGRSREPAKKLSKIPAIKTMTGTLTLIYQLARFSNEDMGPV